MQPSKKVGPDPTTWRSIRAILLASYANVLLVCVPVSWALYFALPEQHTLIFVFSFVAIVPLAVLLDFATDELSIRVGHALGGLIHVTLGNVVELIISIIALTRCEIDIVQSTLLGSILSKLLLVLGMCFFAGGLRFSEQGFALIAAQTNSSLLTISVIAVLLPSAFILTLSGSFDSSSTFIRQKILSMSHGVAIILVTIYVFYLIFQLFSHKDLYHGHKREGTMISKKYDENPFKLKKLRSSKSRGVSESTEMAVITVIPPSAESTFDPEAACVMTSVLFEEETEEPRMNLLVSIVLMVAITAAITITAEFLIDSISGLTHTETISQEFIAVILLPIVANAAEYFIIVTSSVKDKLALSMAVAVGSSIQISFFVIPFMVTLGWILNKPLTFLFDPLQSIVLFLSMLIISYIIRDGRSNWLKGFILICLYIILCVTFWYYPGTDLLLTC